MILEESEYYQTRKTMVIFLGGFMFFSEVFSTDSITGRVPLAPCLLNTCVLCMDLPDGKYEIICSFNPTLETYFAFLAFNKLSYALYLKFVQSLFSPLVLAVTASIKLVILLSYSSYDSCLQQLYLPASVILQKVLNLRNFLLILYKIK